MLLKLSKRRARLTSVRVRVWGALGLFLVGLTGCAPNAEETDWLRSAAAIEIGLSVPEGDLRRPPARFDHAAHTAALKKEGCPACHLKDGDLTRFKFGQRQGGEEASVLMDLYHEKCIGCHRERAEGGGDSGPRVCAGCHVKSPETASLRQEMEFDYSLHYRHVQATGDEKCSTCHHQYDESAKKLVYKKGAEDACRDCHGTSDQGKNLSLKNASHVSCVGCHLQSEAKGKKHGPILCKECHLAENQAKWKKIDLERIPRLLRGQKEKVSILTKDAASKAVIFDHTQHETRARFCTTCHHKTPKPCGDCHTLAGKAEGGGITAEHAFHLVTSERSCVGCHMKETRTVDCSGCHHLPSESPQPSKRTCSVCHAGSRIGDPPVDAGPTSHRESLDAPDASMPDLSTPDGGAVSMPPLPAPSDDFPENVVIKTLAEKYEPSTMPHLRIAKRLDKIVRESRLATTFHGQTEVLCSQCHHHAPLTEKPRPCKACHGREDDASKDKPDLKAAYHRQCMGCHTAMKIEKAISCTDCHKEANQKEAAQ